jgi:hypothetical protein
MPIAVWLDRIQAGEFLPNRLMPVMVSRRKAAIVQPIDHAAIFHNQRKEGKSKTVST